MQIIINLRYPSGTVTSPRSLRYAISTTGLSTLKKNVNCRLGAIHWQHGISPYYFSEPVQMTKMLSALVCSCCHYHFTIQNHSNVLKVKYKRVTLESVRIVSFEYLSFGKPHPVSLYLLFMQLILNTYTCCMMVSHIWNRILCLDAETLIRTANKHKILPDQEKTIDSITCAFNHSCNLTMHSMYPCVYLKWLWECSLITER